MIRKRLGWIKREITEKNKYLAEDKVVLKRLSKVKSLSDKIGHILQEYDEDTIRRLIDAYDPDTITRKIEEEEEIEFASEKKEAKSVRNIGW